MNDQAIFDERLDHFAQNRCGTTVPLGLGAKPADHRGVNPHGQESCSLRHG